MLRERNGVSVRQKRAIAASQKQGIRVPQAGSILPVHSFLSPQLDRLIPTATGEGLPIGTKGHTGNSACMPFEGAQCLTVCQVPQLDRPVRTATGEGLPIRTKGHTQNVVGMPSDRE